MKKYILIFALSNFFTIAGELMVHSTSIPGPAGTIALRIYIPASTGTFASLLFFHGGGWCVGNLDSHDWLCRALCTQLELVIIAVDYRLAPAHPFPAGLNDCYAALLWVARHIADYRGNPHKLFVAGDSAGGNLAASVSLMARDQQGPHLEGQILIYPVLDYNFDTPSYQEHTHGHGLTQSDMQKFWQWYLGTTPSNGYHPYASPLRTPDLSQLPSALVIACQHDPLRDEGLQYAKKLCTAGVAVTCLTYNTIHGFIGSDHKDLTRFC